MSMDEEYLLKNWQKLCAELPESVRLLAVSKYAPDEAVEALVRAGQVDFAESRPQNLRDRSARWPDCRWHMIGPLQKNKAKYVGRYADMWHSLEDIETAEAVAKHVEGRRLPVLIQVNIDGVAGQHGIEAEKLPGLLGEIGLIPQLEPVGLMCMAAAGGDARRSFARLRDLRDRLADGSLRELCMGMSGDYRIAVEEGATMVRLGSALFESGAKE